MATNIKYISIQGNPISFRLNDGAPIECRPNYATKPCIPQDEFDTTVSCQVCEQIF